MIGPQRKSMKASKVFDILMQNVRGYDILVKVHSSFKGDLHEKKDKF